MDITQGRAAAAILAASPPGVTDAILLEGEEDHGWCYVIHWTMERAAASQSFDDVAPPGIGPVAIDKGSSCFAVTRRLRRRPGRSRVIGRGLADLG
jgi:hypothetical protein